MNSMCSSTSWFTRGMSSTTVCCDSSDSTLEVSRRGAVELAGRGVVAGRGARPRSLGESERTLSSESTKNRRPRSVGTRPAEVWGCLRRPASSRSAITLRTVAADSSTPYRRVTVRDPTASPVVKYSLTTADRIFLAR